MTGELLLSLSTVMLGSEYHVTHGHILLSGGSGSVQLVPHRKRTVSPIQRQAGLAVRNVGIQRQGTGVLRLGSVRY
jgi:hypothetical protein